MYIMKFKSRNKKEKIIDLYSETDLPERGWIQGCMHCYQKTSKTCFYKKFEGHKYNYVFNLYLCKDCKRFNKLKDIEFLEKVDKAIYDEYLFSSRSYTSVTPS